MTPQQERILQAAVAALERTTGLNARVHPVKGKAGETDPIVEVKMGRRKHRFGAIVKNSRSIRDAGDDPGTGGALREPLLLVSPYITREVAEHCRQLRLSFIDTAGNALLEAPGSFVCVVGQTRPVELRQGNFRALRPSGLKLISPCCVVPNSC